MKIGFKLRDSPFNKNKVQSFGSSSNLKMVLNKRLNKIALV